MYVTEKRNLDIALNEKYRMIYYFDAICDLIPNNK